MIKLSLTQKFTLGFLLVAVVASLTMAVLIRRSNIAALNQLLLEQDRNLLVEDLTAYYESIGSWEGVAAFIGSRNNIANDGQPAQPPDNRPPNNRPAQPPPSGNRALFGLVDNRGVVLVPLLPEYQLGDQVSTAVLGDGTPVMVDNQQVGTVITRDIDAELTREEESYIQFTNWALLAATAVALVVALLLGYGLTRSLTRPVRDLTHATQTIADGAFGEQVPVRSHDELGELTMTFNQMSSDLAYAAESRKQLTADIAHDLRSPLTVLSGYLESMADGVLQPTPARFAAMQQEVDHLQHLVADLRTLSLADSGALTLQLEEVDVAELLQRTAVSFQHQANQQQITLSVHTTDPLPPIQADPARMAQLLGNLLNNAIRHTPANGQIQLLAQGAKTAVTITVQDNGEGIAPKDLPHIFDRFYRADTARHSEQSGMGLTIAKMIAEAHKASINVTSEPRVKTAFTITFPI